MLKLVDCSRHDNERMPDGVLRFNQVKAAGYHAAVPRWGTGNNKDPYFRSNLSGAISAGLQPGGYWVPYPGNNHAADARQFLADTRAITGGTLDGVAITLDLEDYSGGGHLTRAEANTCIAALQDGAGHDPLAYCPRWWMSKYSGDWATPPVSLPWWDSSYPYGNNPPPAGWVPPRPSTWRGWVCQLWQFTSSGQVPGMSSATDISAFYGTEADWNAMTGGEAMPTADEVADAVISKILANRNPGTLLYAIRQEVARVASDTGHRYWTNQFGDVMTQLAALSAQVAALTQQGQDESTKIATILSALSAINTAGLTDEQVQSMAAQVVASLQAAGVTANPAQILDALKQRLEE